eukprot:gene24327-9933_t
MNTIKVRYLHPSSFILHPSSFILHPSSFILHPSSFILHPHARLDPPKHNGDAGMDIRSDQDIVLSCHMANVVWSRQGSQQHHRQGLPCQARDGNCPADCGGVHKRPHDTMEIVSELPDEGERGVRGFGSTDEPTP